MVQYLFCSTYVIYVPFQRHFFRLGKLCFLSNPIFLQFMSPLMALIANPDVNKYIKTLLCVTQIWTQDNSKLASADISLFSQQFMSVLCFAIQVVLDERSQVTRQLISAKSKIFSRYELLQMLIFAKCIRFVKRGRVLNIKTVLMQRKVIRYQTFFSSIICASIFTRSWKLFHGEIDPRAHAA